MGADYHWSVGQGMVDSLLRDGGQVATPEYAPGDALLFDQMTLHCTGLRSGMTRDRWAVETWLFSPSAFPMKQMPLVL